MGGAFLAFADGLQRSIRCMGQRVGLPQVTGRGAHGGSDGWARRSPANQRLRMSRLLLALLPGGHREYIIIVPVHAVPGVVFAKRKRSVAGDLVVV